MLERLSPDARRVIQTANVIAWNESGPHLGSEYVLAAFLDADHHPDSGDNSKLYLVRKALGNAGVTRARIANEVKQQYSRNDSKMLPISGIPTFSDDLRSVIDHASALRRQQQPGVDSETQDSGTEGSKFVSPDDLLEALIALDRDSDSPVIAIMGRLDIDMDALREIFGNS